MDTEKNTTDIKLWKQFSIAIFLVLMIPFIIPFNIINAIYKDLIPKKFPTFKNLINRTKRDYRALWLTLKPLLTFKKIIQDNRSPYFLHSLLKQKDGLFAKMLNKNVDPEERLNYFVFQDKDKNLNLVKHENKNKPNIKIIKEFQSGQINKSTLEKFKIQDKLKLSQLAYNYDSSFYTLKELDSL